MGVRQRVTPAAPWWPAALQPRDRGPPADNEHRGPKTPKRPCVGARKLTRADLSDWTSSGNPAAPGSDCTYRPLKLRDWVGTSPQCLQKAYDGTNRRFAQQ